MAEISKQSIKKIIISEKENVVFRKIKNVSDFRKAIENSIEKNISELLNLILGGAASLDASDLHIEPEENSAKIRARIDGLLQDVIELKNNIYISLISRIKLLSGLKLNISDRAQDGRFSIILPETSLDVRSSSLPAEYGESMVLRILNPKNLIGLESLGLRDDLLALFTKEISKPNGMILVTGPTGSGKTTTLYAFLKEIRNPEIKIITIEDPIEYHLKGISQTQTDSKKGYDFASGLKSIVRQDPDVILVGEVRDKETAVIALQAALTGHLVLSTLHTNDASGAVARLISLGAKIENVGPAINMAVAQRLIRKVCKNCSEEEKIPLKALKEVQERLKEIPKTIKIPTLDANLKIAIAKGCKTCNNTGFSGRLGVYECFLVDAEMEKFIASSPTASEMKERALKKGMVSMYQDGLIKVLEKKTTLEEVKKSVTD